MSAPKMEIYAVEIHISYNKLEMVNVNYIAMKANVFFLELIMEQIKIIRRQQEIVIIATYTRFRNIFK